MDIANEFDKVKLARINELAKIAKERELTEEEFQERAVLRKEFLENFRAGFRQQLSSITVVSPDETVEEETIVEETADGKTIEEDIIVEETADGETIEEDIIIEESEE